MLRGFYLGAWLVTLCRQGGVLFDLLVRSVLKQGSNLLANGRGVFVEGDVRPLGKDDEGLQLFEKFVCS